MNKQHKKQVVFLQRKLELGLNGRDLFALFKERFGLGIKSYERRVAEARRAIGGIKKKQAINWVLVNIMHDGNNPQRNDPKAPQEKDPPDTDTKSPQVSTEGKRENTLMEKRENTPQPEVQKTPHAKAEKVPQKRSVVSAAAEVTAAAENLLCMEVLSVEECLLMLSRFAMGQYVRARHFSCGGEVVEVQETPPFAARRSAVMAILKYHEAVAKEKGTPEYDDPSRYVTMTTNELFNMSKERMRELSLEIHRKREEIQNKR
jgi:hypothetical protein